LREAPTCIFNILCTAASDQRLCVRAPQFLQLIAEALRPLGRRAAFYLAAAVSDFFVPWAEMVSRPQLLLQMRWEFIMALLRRRHPGLPAGALQQHSRIEVHICTTAGAHVQAEHKMQSSSGADTLTLTLHKVSRPGVSRRARPLPPVTTAAVCRKHIKWHRHHSSAYGQRQQAALCLYRYPQLMSRV
jgi:hypothetical protein